MPSRRYIGMTKTSDASHSLNNVQHPGAHGTEVSLRGRWSRWVRCGRPNDPSRQSEPAPPTNIRSFAAHCPRALKEWLGRRKVALGLKQAREVVEAPRRVGMLRAEHLLPDCQRALEE
jgi:hypothetical protein